MAATGLVFEDFADKVGQVFTVGFADGPAVALTLAEAERLKAYHVPPDGRLPFSLIFLGPSEATLPQRLYWLEQDTLGQIELFLVPVGRDARGVQYQSVFN
ncbi:MAG TPA: hypothetical protein VGB91_14065 [Rhizomicrobium sp.]